MLAKEQGGSDRQLVCNASWLRRYSCLKGANRVLISEDLCDCQCTAVEDNSDLLDLLKPSTVLTVSCLLPKTEWRLALNTKQWCLSLSYDAFPTSVFIMWFTLWVTLYALTHTHTYTQTHIYTLPQVNSCFTYTLSSPTHSHKQAQHFNTHKHTPLL